MVCFLNSLHVTRKLNLSFCLQSFGWNLAVSLTCYSFQSISAYSGHYRPTEDRLDSFLSFLQENGVNLDEVEVGVFFFSVLFLLMPNVPELWTIRFIEELILGKAPSQCQRYRKVQFRIDATPPGHQSSKYFSFAQCSIEGMTMSYYSLRFN